MRKYGFFVILLLSIVSPRYIMAQDSEVVLDYNFFQKNMPELIGEWVLQGNTFGRTPYCFRINKSLSQDGGYYIEIPYEMELLSRKDNLAAVSSWDRGELGVFNLFKGDNGWGYSFSPLRIPSPNIYTVVVKKKGQKRGYEEIFRVHLAIRGIIEDESMFAYVQYWDEQLHDIGMCRFIRTRKIDRFEYLSKVTADSPENEIRELARAVCIDTYIKYDYSKYQAERNADLLETELMKYAQEIRDDSGFLEIIDIGGPIDLMEEFQKFVEEKIKSSVKSK